jgi:hypothetical protein
VNDRVDEEIGALLDGRLDLHRRTELLTRLATDDADYEVFADTAAVLREAEEDGSSAKESASGRELVRETGVIPLRPRRATVWRVAVPLAIAAGLAALALVPVLRSRLNGDSWRDPDHLYALSWTPGARLPAPWEPAWGATRGGGGVADETGIAARVGALHLDMVVSANAGDSAQVSERARTAAAVLKSADESGPSWAAPGYGDIAQLTPWARRDVLRRLEAARTDVVRVVDPDYFALGAWTEAGRLAASRKDAAFFSTRESRKALEQAVSLHGLNDDAKDAAIRLRAVPGQGAIRDWTSVSRNLDALQRGLAR